MYNLQLRLKRFLHYTFYIIHSSHGFTLLEILVVIAVLTVSGIILTQIFISTLRASNKAQVISILKQNGQNVLDIMDKEIRGARQVIDTCDTDGSGTQDTVMIEDRDGGYKKFRLIMPSPASNPTTNGYIIQEVATKDTLCFDTIATDYTTLTDTDTLKGVSVGPTSSFTRNPAAGFNDAITIDFYLGPGVQAPRIIREQVDPIQFKTTIVLR